MIEECEKKNSQHFAVSRNSVTIKLLLVLNTDFYREKKTQEILNAKHKKIFTATTSKIRFSEIFNAILLDSLLKSQNGISMKTS